MVRQAAKHASLAANRLKRLDDRQPIIFIDGIGLALQRRCLG
jgi:hypothetical protein